MIDEQVEKTNSAERERLNAQQIGSMECSSWADGEESKAPGSGVHARTFR